LTRCPSSIWLKADLAHVQVLRDAARAVLEFEQLVGHGRGQT